MRVTAADTLCESWTETGTIGVDVEMVSGRFEDQVT